MARIISERVVILNEALYHPPKPVQSVAAAPAEQVQGVSVVGLGDLVERYAHPMAVVIDRMTLNLPPRWRTGLAWCTACSRRRSTLNEWVPDVRSGLEWWAVAGRLWRFMQGR